MDSQVSRETVLRRIKERWDMEDSAAEDLADEVMALVAPEDEE